MYSFPEQGALVESFPLYQNVTVPSKLRMLCVIRNLGPHLLQENIENIVVVKSRECGGWRL